MSEIKNECKVTDEREKIRGEDVEKIQREFIKYFNLMCELVAENAEAHGWWTEGDRTNKAQELALIHCEISETVEALRKGNPVDQKLPEFTEGELELADAVIRAMDVAVHWKWRLAEALVTKHRYNVNRPYKHGGKLF